ncbi:GlcNAc transferase, partial [Chelativorans composti]
MARVSMRTFRVPQNALRAFSLIAMGALAACSSTGGSAFNDLLPVDPAQASAENIASLTAVISRSPNDPEAYNVRGSAYGRA